MDEISSCIQEVVKSYPVRKVALFGSAARGELTDTSDIDVIVEFDPGSRGILFFGLWEDLQQALKRSVDLIEYPALTGIARPQFRENVLRDERVIYERPG